MTSLGKTATVVDVNEVRVHSNLKVSNHALNFNLTSFLILN